MVAQQQKKRRRRRRRRRCAETKLAVDTRDGDPLIAACDWQVETASSALARSRALAPDSTRFIYGTQVPSRYGVEQQ